MKLTYSTVPLGKLIVSPLNARPRDLSADDVGDLIPSIRALGLANPLTVHELAKPKGKFGVVAGQRRWRALLELASDPAIDAAAIPVMIAEGTEAELREISIHENESREDMDEVELLRAFLALRKADPKISDEQLAVRFGTDPKDVKQIMRLAALHPTILSAYAQNQMSGEMARAYAGTADQGEQMECFKHIQKLNEWQRSEREVRRFYGFGTAYSAERQLEIVGRDMFLAAGGKIEDDLFSDDMRIIGADILDELFKAKSRDMIDAYVEANPRVTLVEDADLPRGQYGSSDYQLRIPSDKPVPEDVDLLGTWQVTAEGLAVKLYWPSRDAAGLEPFDKVYPSTAAAVNAQAEAEYGPKATAKAEAVMRSMRVNMLTSMLMDSAIDAEGDNVRRAHRALIFDLARNVLASSDRAEGMESYGTAYYGTDLGPIAPPLMWTTAEWATLPHIQAWPVFERLSDRDVDELAAYIYARRVTGSHFKEKRVIVPDTLGTVLAVPSMARRYLELDDKFFAMFNKAQIMGFIEEACTAPSPVTGKPMEMSATLKTKLGKYKMKDLQAAAVMFFSGADQALKLVGATPHRQGFLNWVPSWLRWHDHETTASAMYPSKPTEQMLDEAA